ncbi:ABC transporter ATP-binding protein/permease [Vibrio sp. JC009]|uniref:ABC transporter ATP-binding protein n=1 Tax=Vibrio sp. JC009 TaxID=2912314 RepID=UPI0023AFA7B5|nr:ABC transporter ATP-binding protein [Vibrio sp. JC009]WED23348.1 ABC transporter ATP-binding protein/permease [Vibrio sp. JC009]
MNKIAYLLKHSKASHRDFWVGVSGKIASEALPLICWLILFVFLREGIEITLTHMVLISIAVIVGQWIFGQTAKQSFLGAYDISHQLRKTLLLDIRSQPLAALTGKGLGEKIKLVTTDMKQFEHIFSHLAADFIAAWVIPIAMTGVIFMVNPVLGALLLGVVSIAWGILLFTEKRFSNSAQHNHCVNLACANKTLEYIECLPMLKSFGRADKLASPLCDQIEALRKSGLGLEWAGGTGVVFATLVLELSGPLVALVGADLVIHGVITSGEWLVVVIACVASTRPFVRMTIFSALLRYMIKAAHRLHDLATAPHQPHDGVLPTHFDIELKDVSFEMGEQTVLKDINLQVKQGQHLAITGPSGSGKTTLLNLIAAFHIATRGHVQIGGKSLEEAGTYHWYKSLSYITQHVQLFAGSLRDNLLIANSNASDADLNEAIRQAGLDDLIQRLPAGLESEIGENGNLLSGGERQRLSIARALMRQTPIVLLDEVTSALDAENQKQILETLRTLCQGKTVITIAHRLETITHADQICLMEQGQILAVAEHTSLLADNETYQKIWFAQNSLKNKAQA